MLDYIRKLVTPDMVSFWVPSGQKGGIDLIGRNPKVQCIGTHPNVPVIMSDSALGSLDYDNLSGVFVVGELVLAGTSGSQGRIVSDNGSTLALEKCIGRFNDDEEITGGTSGATADVNHPDTGVGVDLLRNGEAEGGVGGWTTSNGTLASIAGGKVGNCFELTRTGETHQEFYQDIGGLSVGKFYKLSAHIESGTSGNQTYYFRVYTPPWTPITNINGESSGAWVKDSVIFQSPTANIRVVLQKYSSTEGTMLFDEASLYELNRQHVINPSVGWVFGGDDYIQFDSPIIGTDPFSIFAWVYLPELPSVTLEAILSNYALNYMGFVFYIQTTGEVYFQVGRVSDTSLGTAISVGKIIPHTWHFVGGAYDGVKPIVVLDDVFEEGGDFSPIEAETTNMRIGRGWDRYFHGHGTLSGIVDGAWSQQQFENFRLATRGLFAPRG